MNTVKIMVNELNNIRNESSTGGKQSLLDKLYRTVSKPLLIRFLQYVYSPYLVYNISFPDENEISKLNTSFGLPITDIKTLLDQLEYFFIRKKLRGKAGKKALLDIYNFCDRYTKILLKMIIDRDLKIGMNVTTINKVIPNCIPEAQYMGAVGFNGFLDLINRSSEYVDDDVVGIIQAKADGLFAFYDINNKTFISRRLKEILFVDKALQKQINTLKIYGQKNGYLSKKSHYTLHGELTIDGIPDRLKANGIFKALTTLELKKLENAKTYKKYADEFKKVFDMSDTEMRKKIRYTVWDITETNATTLLNMKRFNFLKRLINNFKDTYPDIEFFQLIEYDYIQKYSFEKIIDFFEDQLIRGNEGAIYKVANGVFNAGHSTDCIKFKNIFDFDLKIVGFEEGKNKNTLGALVCESEDGLVKTNLSGINQKLKEEIWNNKEKFLGKIVEGEANDITKSDKNEYYSLMHPRFLTIRDDKIEADTLEKIQLSNKSFGLISTLRDNLHNDLIKANINKEA